MDHISAVAKRWLSGSAQGTQKWDLRFMQAALLVRSWSKDPSTQVGAIISHGNALRATGFNGFPPGINDDRAEYWERPDKYDRISHAEENAINFAHKHGVSCRDCTIHVPKHPCAACARRIISVGMVEVVTLSPYKDESGFFDRWSSSIHSAESMFREAGVRVRFIDKHALAESLTELFESMLSELAA